MRITVDASPLLLRSAGVKNYLYYWIDALRRNANGHSVSGYPFLGEVGALTHEGSVIGRTGTVARIAWLLAGNRFAPARRLAASGSRVFHVSNQVHGGVRGMALTATLYDMTCWLTPEFHTPANIAADRRYAERILQRADALISISENSRQDAIRILGLAPEKVTVIYPGVPPVYFQVTEADAARVTAELGLKKPFFLHVGTVEPRKNLDALLDAYLMLPASIRSEVDLVLAGPMGWAAGATAERVQSKLPGVRYIGYVKEVDLPGLTRAAKAFVYPSLYEGFGLPPAQAMAAGVPVLTSNNSCLPEVTGDGAIHADPRSPESIRDGMEQILNPATAARLVEAGRQKAQDYRWDNCARQSWEFFEQFA